MATEFNFFWYGGHLPILHWAGLASFVRMEHKVTLHAYEPLDVPRGVSLVDAGEIIPLDDLFLFSNPLTGKPDVGPFSDLFRFKLLWMRGGWWSDTDVICLSGDIPDCTYAWAQIVPEIDPGALSPSQIRFPQGDTLIEELYRNCLESSRSIESREHLGPKTFSRTLAKYPVPPGHWGSADEFYPIRWIETFKLWLPEFRDEVYARCRSAAFLSTMNSMHVYMDMLDKMPPRGSWLDDTYRALAPERMTEEHYTREDVLFRVRSFLRKNRHYAYSDLERTCGPELMERLRLRPEDAVGGGQSDAES
jgi:hypothetical protein